MRTVAIVPAAGSGVRMGGATKKQFYTIGGKPILAHTLERLSSSNMVEKIILVAPSDEKEACSEIINEYGIKKVLSVVDGGITRQESVSHGFYSLPKGTDIVLIHDGVRPFVTVKMIEGAIEAAAAYGASITAIRIKDTLKKVDDGDVLGTISRDNVVRVQTPQCFRYDELKRGLEEAAKDGFVATDESSLVERQGLLVRVVDGDETNIKITTPGDLKIAEALLKVF